MFPNVLLEATASGLSVEATDIPGNRDAVRGGVTGLLVPPRDSYALAFALHQLVSQSELRLDMGKTARLSILERRLLWEEGALGHTELYRQMLSR